MSTETLRDYGVLLKETEIALLKLSQQTAKRAQFDEKLTIRSQARDFDTISHAPLKWGLNVIFLP